MAGGAIDLILDQPTTLWSFEVLYEPALLALAAERETLPSSNDRRS